MQNVYKQQPYDTYTQKTKDDYFDILIRIYLIITKFS